MKSVLLGGLKVWLVNDGGRPLSAPGGRAKFYKAGTSTPATVYSDIDLTEDDALGPVVATDKLGYLPAIWLKTDKLYKVVVEQRIGADPEQWEVLWEVDNVGYVDTSEWGGGDDRFLFVDSISDLKQVDHSEYGHVFVTGYYAPGDWGEPSLFVWDGESRKTADDGAYVLPNDVLSTEAGRWVQMFDGDILDVRKFGALPDMMQNSDIQWQVLKAINYSQENSTRMRPITVGFVAPGKYGFAGDFYFPYYEFVDLSDNSHHPINWFIGEDVVFYKAGDTALTITLSKDTRCVTREALITGNWITLAVEGGGSIEVDPAWWGNYGCTITDCYVKCHSVTTNNKTFVRCDIESENFLDGYVELEQMDFKERWFKSGFTWSHLTLTDVTYGVRDCVSANSYVDIKNSQGDPVYDDMDGLEVKNKTLLADAIISNAVFDAVTLSAGAVTMSHVKGTVTFFGSSHECDFRHCELKVLNDTDVTIASMTIEGGKLNVPDCRLQATAYFDATDAFVRGGLKLLGVYRARFVRCLVEGVYGKLFEVSMVDRVDPSVFELDGCTVYADVNQRAVLNDYDGNYYVRFRIHNCQFLGASGRHTVVSSENANAIVVGSWTDNFAESTNPIMLDSSASAFDSTDENHDYVYEGNSGTFLPSGAKAVKVYGSAQYHVGNPSSDHDWTLVDSGLTVISGNFDYYEGIYVNSVSESLESFSISYADWLVKVSFEMQHTESTYVHRHEISGKKRLQLVKGSALNASVFNGEYVERPVLVTHGESGWDGAVVTIEVERVRSA